MTPELDRHLRSFTNFPSPPGVASRLIELAHDPDLVLSEVANAISMDASLATKILRIANSPLYAQVRRTDTLKQALVVLGLNATLALSLSFSLVKSLRGAKPNSIDFPWYWRRGLLAGVAARSLGEAAGHSLLEELFLAGLVQDIGMLALDRAVVDLYKDTQDLQHTHGQLSAHERKKFGHDHAEVGAWLLKQWNLPSRLVQAVELSHSKDIRRCLDLTDCFNRCVGLSGAIADIFLNPQDERTFIETAQQVQRVFDLDKTAFVSILDRISAVLPDTSAVFETALIDDPVSVVARARSVLDLQTATNLRDLQELRAEVQTLTQRATEIEARSQLDPLSGALNRGPFEVHLKQYFERAVLSGAALSIAVCVIDDIQRIRDVVGSQADALVLQATTKTLTGCIRSGDLVTRYGAEEFVIILALADETTTRDICQRIVVAAQTTRHSILGHSLPVSLSVGFATHEASHPFENAEALLKAAQQAVHTATLHGSHQIAAYAPVMSRPRAYFL